jgi:single-stranded DNA-binding protein
MSGFAELQLQGNLTRDPEIKQTKDDENYAIVTLAVNTSKDEEPDFYTVFCFKYHGENAVKYLKLGSAVQFNCDVKTSSWTDEETGVVKEGFRLTAQGGFRGMRFVQGADTQGNNGKKKYPKKGGGNWGKKKGNDLPF